MTYRYIYKITCTAGSFKDKFYFGQRTTTKLDDDYKGSGKLILDYYKKHPNDYVKEIISFHNSQEELDKAEYNIIHPWLNNENCLNLRDGGNVGTYSEETRRKMSKSKLGTHLSEETRNKMSESHKGKIKTEEHRKHLSESRKGKKFGPLTEETRRKIGEASKGRVHSEETRKKMSESHKGKIKTEEHRKHLSESRKGIMAWNKSKQLSEEHRRKLSEAHKGKIPWNKGKHLLKEQRNK